MAFLTKVIKLAAFLESLKFIKSAGFYKNGQKWGSKMGPKTRKTSKNSDFGVAIAHCF